MLKYWFYFCVFALCFGQLASVYKSGGLNIYLFDVAIISFGVIGTLYLLLQEQYKIGLFLGWLGLFVFYAFFSLVPQLGYLSNLELAVSAFYGVRLFFYFISGVVVYNMLDLGLITKKELLDIFIYSGLFVAVTGFIQLLILPDLELLDTALGWDPHKHRLVGGFLDPNFAGAYIVLSLTLLIHQILETGYHSDKRNYAIGSVLLIALVLTFSRSAWLMFGAVVFIYGVFKSRKILLLSLLIIFLAYFAVPRVQTRISGITDPADSAHFRLISWQNTMEIASNNLLLGVGYNSFRYAQIEHGVFSPGDFGGHAGAGSDSSFLLVLATTGFGGLIVFVYAYFWPIIRLFYARDSHSLMLLTFLASLFVGSQFINSVFFPAILFFWISVLSLVSYSASDM